MLSSAQIVLPGLSSKMDKQAVTTHTKWRKWKKVDFWIKSQLKRCMLSTVWLKKLHSGGEKNQGNEVEAAISYQNNEIVIACLKPSKLFVVQVGTKIH